MTKRMRTAGQIEAERRADRAARLARMTERELTAYAGQIANEIADNGMDCRLKLDHFAIRDQIRAELAARRETIAA